ncbi:MAG: MOSC domain-containing protein [Pseudomonadota bacterium]
MIRLEEIRRNPIKGFGQEVISSARLEAGEALPWDRVWALTHGNSEWDDANPRWVRSRNHVIQTTCSALSQITCAYDGAAAMTLTHPQLGEITFDPTGESDRLAEWIEPIAGESGPPPYRLVTLPGGRLHDFEDTHFSIGSLSSLRALEGMAGASLDRIRFRMNLWIDGAAPWEEVEWEGREIMIGSARLKITGMVKRCAATHANAATGKRDIEVTRLLYDRFGHMNFGVYAQVLEGGRIAQGAEVSV